VKLPRFDTSVLLLLSEAYELLRLQSSWPACRLEHQPWEHEVISRVHKVTRLTPMGSITATASSSSAPHSENNLGPEAGWSLTGQYHVAGREA
jgi:hypothetical protein